MAPQLRTLIVATHPVQYATPQFRALSADARIDLTVAYLSMQSAEAGIDPEFGVEVRWDVPLLDGYRWIHPANRSPRPVIEGFFGLVNPSLWRTVRRGRYDVVVCYGYRAASFWIAALAAWISGAAVVWTTDATSLEPRLGGKWKRRIKRWVLPVVFRSGTAALAPSSRGVAFVRSLGVPRDRVFMTPDVVDNAFFAGRSRAVDVAATRRDWGMPDDAFVAVFVGKLVTWKRPQDLLRAAVEAREVRLVFAGEGPLRADMERLAKELAIDDRVRFIGFQNQSELSAVYRSADVLVLPSEYEPFGLVVNEAFACGTPAIVSDACGCVGDLISDGVTGYAYPAGNIKRLTERLRFLAEHAELRADLSDGARERIGEWDLDASREAIISALTAIAALKRRGFASTR